VKGVLSYAWFWHEASNRVKGYFSKFAPATFRAARAVYPDLEIVVHHDDHLDEEPYGAAMRRLAAAGVLRLIDCGPSQGISHSSLWRLLPVFATEAGLVVCRDLDSLVSVRERWAVEAFVASGKAAHAINDVQAHRHRCWPEGYLMPGTCAFYRPVMFGTVSSLKPFEEWMLRTRRTFSIYGTDEEAINEIMQPVVRGNLLAHLAPEGPGRADIREMPLTAMLDSQVLANPIAYTEYVGMTMREPEPATRFYSGTPTTRIFDEVRA